MLICSFFPIGDVTWSIHEGSTGPMGKIDHCFMFHIESECGLDGFLLDACLSLHDGKRTSTSVVNALDAEVNEHLEQGLVLFSFCFGFELCGWDCLNALECYPFCMGLLEKRHCSKLSKGPVEGFSVASTK